MTTDDQPDGPVVLTWYEFVSAVHTGLDRFTTSEAARLDHSRSVARDYLQRLVDEVVGACGEQAYSKDRNVYWDHSVGTFHHTPDVGRVEVRSTTKDDGSLIIRDNDPPDRPYVLAIAHPPFVWLRGWLPGREARRDEYVKNPPDKNGDRKRPSWFVPQNKLRPYRRSQ